MIEGRIKTTPIGKPGAEKPGLLDSAGQLRDRSAVLTDIAASSLLPESLDRLRQLNFRTLPPQKSISRLDYLQIVGHRENAGDAVGADRD